MTIVASLTLHTPGMPNEAKRAVGVAIAYAQLNDKVAEHKMGVLEFRRLTLFGYGASHEDLQKMVICMGRAACTLRLKNFSVEPKRQVLVSSFGVFRTLVLTDSEVRFSITPATLGHLDAVLSDTGMLRELKRNHW